MSSYTRSAILTGKFIAGTLGQLLISFKATSYYGLNVISMVSVFCSLFVALALPNVRQTVYFHREIKDGSGSNEGTLSEDSQIVDSSGLPPTNDTRTPGVEGEAVPPSVPNHSQNVPEETWYQQFSTTCQTFTGCCRANFTPLWSDFKICYGDFHLLKWSLWWAFATCGDFQVGNYIQNLWEIIFKKPENSQLNTDLYNGAVEAAATLTGNCSILINRENVLQFRKVCKRIIAIKY